MVRFYGKSPIHSWVCAKLLTAGLDMVSWLAIRNEERDPKWSDDYFSSTGRIVSEFETCLYQNRHTFAILSTDYRFKPAHRTIAWVFESLFIIAVRSYYIVNTCSFRTKATSRSCYSVPSAPPFEKLTVSYFWLVRWLVEIPSVEGYGSSSSPVLVQVWSNSLESHGALHIPFYLRITNSN